MLAPGERASPGRCRPAPSPVGSGPPDLTRMVKYVCSVHLFLCVLSASSASLRLNTSSGY